MKFKVSIYFISGPVFHEIEEDSYPEAPAPSRNTSYSSLLSLDNNHPISSHGLRQVINQHIDTGSDTENSLEMDDEPIDASVNVPNQSKPSNSEAFEMACSFVRWFYPLINGSLKCDTDYGSQHFWIDANAHVILQAPNSNTESSVVEDNGKLSAELLRDIIKKHNVNYNPNISKEGKLEFLIFATVKLIFVTVNFIFVTVNFIFAGVNFSF